MKTESWVKKKKIPKFINCFITLLMNKVDRADAGERKKKDTGWGRLGGVRAIQRSEEE